VALRQETFHRTEGCRSLITHGIELSAHTFNPEGKEIMSFFKSQHDHDQSLWCNKVIAVEHWNYIDI
jgi:hypothetical protein